MDLLIGPILAKNGWIKVKLLFFYISKREEKVSYVQESDIFFYYIRWKFVNNKMVTEYIDMFYIYRKLE